MLYKILYPLAKIYWKIVRPITFGVRIIIFDQNNNILLVKHTYLPGWMLPGGGVQYSEQFDQTARREVWEETGIKLKQVDLFGVYKFNEEGKRDHIFVFSAPINKFPIQFQHDKLEIDSIKTFSLKKLPKDISPGHCRRIIEFSSGKIPNFGTW